MYRVMGAGQKNCKIILVHKEVEQIKFIVVSWVQGFLSGQLLDSLELVQHM